MCGINGFNFRNKGLIEKMNRVIKHRGPDDGGIYLDDGISLGNVRLAIIDLSRRGRMPMVDKQNSVWITYNGEIYNFKKLRKQLAKDGYAFRSETDTEVILYLYKRYGEKCFAKLDGMFALGLWDARQKKLILARDRFGIKPLYYYFDGKRLFFSSEIKALLCCRLKREVNREAFQVYMRCLYVPGEQTILSGIKKLLPGQVLIYTKNRIWIKPYWQLSWKPKINDKDYLKKKIRSILERSVEGELVADRPVGIFLSGGLDSTTILSLASRRVNKPIKTFSVGYEVKLEREKYNADFVLARKSAQFFHADHHELILSSDEALRVLEKSIWYLDEPIANPNAVSIYLLSKMATKEVKVVLGGDGGDELFGGYDRYNDAQLLSLYQKIPRIFRKNGLDNLLRWVLHRDSGFPKRLQIEDPVGKYLIFMAEEEAEIQKIMKDKITKEELYPLFQRYIRNNFSSFFDQFSYLDFNNWLPHESLLKSDKLTMASGLEQRVPFLNNELMELSFRIPARYKIGLKTGKKIFKETFADILPPDILYAKKRGYLTPASKWLLEPRWQKYLRQVLSKEEITKHGLFNATGIEKMIKNHTNLQKHNANLIWAMLTFQIWYNQVKPLI